MYSIGEARKRLPKEYIEYLYAAFPAKAADGALQAAARPLPSSLRVNSLRSDIHPVMDTLRSSGLKFQRLPWFPQALLFDTPVLKKLQVLPEYSDGRIYLQSLSSMVPPLLLPLHAGQAVLDLCAAPGSKTTQMAALMRNQGSILAVEVDTLRMERLQYNLKRQGVTIVETKAVDGTKVGRMSANYFDAVLVDAPCSGEGRFRLDEPKTYRSWNVPMVKKLARLQKRLLHSGLDALKPGGHLVYSTCTINTNENEAVVAAILQARSDVEILPARLPGLKVTAGLTQTQEERWPSALKQSMRIWPTPVMEGFYCCLLRKRS